MRVHSPYRSLTSFPPRDCLRLIRTENVGPITFFDLVNMHGSPAKAIDAIPHMAVRGGLKRKLNLPSLSAIDKELDDLSAINARILLYGSAEYSSLLENIYDPPPLLFALGNAGLLRKNSFAIVGSRAASINARTFTRKITEDVGSKGYIITSGLARGIDTEAHKAALTTGTIAVIAGGIDNIYPPENAELYAGIIESGVIISENPVGTAPTATSFPRRNRIISGLSLGVLVVEASLNSGSLITARCAIDQGRDVFAMPGSPLDARSKGANMLIKNGAVLVESSADILDALRIYGENRLSVFQNTNFEEQTAMPVYSEEELNAARTEMLSALSFENISLDEICAATEIPPALTRATLLELELADKVHRSPCGRFSLSAASQAA